MATTHPHTFTSELPVPLYQALLALGPLVVLVPALHKLLPGPELFHHSLVHMLRMVLSGHVPIFGVALLGAWNSRQICEFIEYVGRSYARASVRPSAPACSRTESYDGGQRARRKMREAV